MYEREIERERERETLSLVARAFKAAQSYTDE